MVNVKTQSTAPVEPGPKYGHLSKLDPQFAPMKSGIDESFVGLWKLPIDEFKAAWLSAPLVLPDNAPLTYKDYDLEDQQVAVSDGANIGVRLYKPINRTGSDVLVLKAHGGGWVVGSHEVEEVENRMLAAHANCLVVSVDYRMAPEFKFPYAVNDCFDVLKWCKANASTLGINPERIIIAGGSAGGNITAALALKTRDEGVSGIIGQVLNIPVTCHPTLFPKDKYELNSYDQNKDGSVVNGVQMEWFWEQYMPDPQPHPYASPLLAKDLSKLPPALIQVAGADPLRDEGLAYGDALKAAGNDVTVEIYPGLPHGFYFLPVPQAQDYWQKVIQFVQRITQQEARELDPTHKL